MDDKTKLTREEMEEAAVACYGHAAWLEDCANNDPDPSRRRDLLRRAWASFHAAEKLRAGRAGE